MKPLHASHTHCILRTASTTPINLAIKTFILLVTLIALATGCKRDDDIAPVDPLTANAGPDQQVQVGQLVSLDGSASLQTPGKPATIQWQLIRKPAKSTAALSDPAALKPTFTPDEVGEYELELKLTNADGASSDKVLITASTAQPVTLDKDINVKTLLADRVANPNLPDYIVPKDIAVKAELTIAPGVVVAFERDTRLSIVADGGILIAQGTADKKIRFIGTSPTKGFWSGIMLFSESNVNVMDHVEILHAGSETMLNNTKMGMAMSGNSQMAIKNTLFAQNDGYGLYVYGGGILREFSANTFTANTEAGIILDAESVHKLDAATRFTGDNGRNVVEVVGDYVGNNTSSSTELTWTGFADKTPYRVLRTLMVRSGWKLSPGVTIQVARDMSIIIDESGYVNAQGTTALPIRFTGISNTAAYWRGMLVHSGSTQNQIVNAEISNAGSIAIVSGKRANLALYGDEAAISVRNTRISGSGGYGILASYGTTLNSDAVTTNTFENNSQTNVQIEHE